MSGAASHLGVGASAGSNVPAGARRLEGWAGEVRLNLVRLAAVLLFYGYHLIHGFLSGNSADLGSAYHISVTALVMVWSVGVAALWLYLSRRWVPPALKYVVTAWDTLLITTLLVLAGGPPGPLGGAPRSPLIILYFLVIAAAPLRLSIRLVYAATLLALAAYGFLLAHYAFYLVGYQRYYTDPDPGRIPRTQEVIVVLGLVAAGVLAGQVVRQTRRLLDGQTAGADSGTAARDSEVRRDTTLVAGGLVVVAVLVALGLLYSATVGPQSAAMGSFPALPVVVVIGVLFVIAVGAVLAEARRPPGPPRDRTSGG